MRQAEKLDFSKIIGYVRFILESKGQWLMAELPFIPFYVGDYLADTRHLTAEQHGAYVLLLFAMWRADDCSIPGDARQLARIASVTPARWERISGDVMAFMTLTEGGRVTQKRLAKEHKNAKEMRDKKVKAGKAAAAAKSLKNKEAGSADVVQTFNKSQSQSQSQSSSNEEDIAPHYVRGDSAQPELIPSGDNLPATTAASPSGKTKKKQAKGEAKIPWPDGFDLDGDLHKYATDAGIAFDAVHDLWERFRAHHVKNGNQWAGERGWRAAWQGWVRNEIKFSRERRGNGGGRPERAAYDPIEHARRRIEQFQQAEEETLWPKVTN